MHVELLWKKKIEKKSYSCSERNSNPLFKNIQNFFCHCFNHKTPSIFNLFCNLLAVSYNASRLRLHKDTSVLIISQVKMEDDSTFIIHTRVQKWPLGIFFFIAVSILETKKMNRLEVRRADLKRSESHIFLLWGFTPFSYAIKNN